MTTDPTNDPAAAGDFDRLGFVIVPELLSADEVRTITACADARCAVDGPERILEETGEPCSVYVRPDDDFFGRVVRLPRLVGLAERLLGGPVYLHQCKINHKVALRGSELLWHRDYVYWKRIDGMPTSRVLTAALLLDPAAEVSAPLLLIEASHLTATDDPDALDSAPSASGGVEQSWTDSRSEGASTVVSPLRYQVSRQELLRLTEHHRIVSVTGQPGTVAFFHGNLVHGSTRNISPWDRRMLFITYNRVDNALHDVPHPRADYIANRDSRPLTPAGDRLPVSAAP